MTSIRTATSRAATPVIAAAAMFAALALPASASAAEPAMAVSVVQGYLSIDSVSSSMPMHVRVEQLDEYTVRVTELDGRTVQTGDHCMTVQDDDTVDCDVTGMELESVHFEGSPYGDKLEFVHGWNTPVLANGWGGRDELNGAAGDDVLHGGDGADTLRGKGGADDVYGEHGHDALGGGAGRDDLYGGHGNDRIFGGAGRDVMQGGHGADRLFAKGDRHSGRDTVRGGAGYDRATLDRHVDSYSSVERRTY